jgi:lysozyme family protein
MSTIIDDIIRREGGFVNHPNDRGGPTKYGITLSTLRQVRNPYVTANDIKSLTEGEARAIYRDLYLRPFEFVTDASLLELLVDCAVNHGVKKAINFLQSALGVKADGIAGIKTQAALRAESPEQIYRKILAERIKFYGDLISRDPSQSVFAAGWMRRVAEFL